MSSYPMQNIPIQNAQSPYIRISQPLQLMAPQQVRPMILNQQQLNPQRLIQYPNMTPIQMHIMSPQQVPQQQYNQLQMQVPSLPRENIVINQEIAKKEEGLRVPDVTVDGMPMRDIIGIENIKVEINRINQAYVNLKKRYNYYKNFYMKHEGKADLELFEENLRKFETIRSLYISILQRMHLAKNPDFLYKMLQNFKEKENEIYNSMKSLYTTQRV